ncbi:sentrin-specific protease 1 [Diabrotica virgifera virgifera]|uniref:Ubiquitin-like protease family profile domain-containing protein n=1 Tax=Diabrotica virgifera virgifera TaxID=50390 RepID=A0ABM5IBS3_DIAVI|nr:sentrin-specific protease 1 [Diabrotica virgifera virgifera]
MDLRAVINNVRNFFSSLQFHPTGSERNRKRSALDSIDSCMSPKIRRVQSINLDRENYYMSPKPLRRPSVYKTPSIKKIESVVLDDDEDDINISSKKINGNTLSGNARTGKFTSTPYGNSFSKKSVNGTDSKDVLFVKELKPSSDEDVTFVREQKSSSLKRADALRKGLNYLRPYSGSISKPKIVQNERQLKEKYNSTFGLLNGTSSFNMNSSIRLNEKKLYREILDSTQFFTPRSSFDNSFMTRRDKIMAAALSPMSTKDRIKKVLDDFDSDPVVIKDSDSDSDVVVVNPPSPKPDIKVEPVNSLKNIINFPEQSKTKWLDDVINDHQQRAAARQRELQELMGCSQQHEKINKDLHIELLSNKINNALKIKEALVPLPEKEAEVELPPLTDEQLRMVSRAFKGDPNEVLSRKFNLNITRRDLLTLSGLNWLNDEVINFYMNMIIERGKDPSYPSCHAFNTFFYTKLLKDGAESLRRWTKKIDIFACDIICIPIHLSMHWCMAIVDMRAKTIKYYDSMGNSNDRCLNAIKKYLEKEHLDKKKSELDTSDFELENVTDIPQQMNGSDCGMFACTFAEFTTRNASITFCQEHMPYLRKKMVVEILAQELLIK